MPQVGWKLYFQDPDTGEIEAEDHTYADAIRWAKTYPVGFNYTPGMLIQMMKLNKERTYPSPSMLPSCPRQVALKKFVDYYVPVKHNWVTYRGTMAHVMMEHEWQEPNAVLEQPVSMPVTLSDGRVVVLQGKPDKHVRLEPSDEHPGQWILIDYKTIETLASKPKVHWTWQTNVYAEMLRHNGILIDRIIIQQIGMSDARQVKIDVKPSEAIMAYVRFRLEKHMGSFDGT